MMRHMRPDSVIAALPILSVGVCEGYTATCKSGIDFLLKMEHTVTLTLAQEVRSLA